MPNEGEASTLTVTVQDSGTVAITSVNIVSLSNVPTLLGGPFIGSIIPGSTMSNSTSITGTAPFLAGDIYTATFVVTFANGATQDTTESLVASTF